MVLNLDNGPENNSRRTQFIQRVVDFVDEHQITVRLAYYPPYHSKYNPVERVWGVLENEWNGDLLDTIPVALGHAQSMTWNGNHPVVRFVLQTAADICVHGRFAAIPAMLRCEHERYAIRERTQPA